MKDALIALVRTTVTAWWGAVVAYFAARGLLPEDAVSLTDSFLAAVVLPAVTGAVYAAVRVVETWLAGMAARGGAVGWLARAAGVLLTGVPRQPVYA